MGLFFFSADKIMFAEFRMRLGCEVLQLLLSFEGKYILQGRKARQCRAFVLIVTDNLHTTAKPETFAEQQATES